MHKAFIVKGGGVLRCLENVYNTIVCSVPLEPPPTSSPQVVAMFNVGIQTHLLIPSFIRMIQIKTAATSCGVDVRALRGKPGGRLRAGTPERNHLFDLTGKFVYLFTRLPLEGKPG